MKPERTQRASRRKHHIVYKTTCQITGRFYFGLHSTDNLDDGYLGSGVRLGRSIKKHGKDSHTRETLREFTTREEASNFEKQIITPEIRKDPMCMNCAPGGMGAVDRPATSEETRAKLSAKSKSYIRTKDWYEKVVATRKANNSYIHSPETRQRLSEINKGKSLSDQHKAAISSGLQGRIVPEETRAKIGAANSAAQKGKPKGPKSEEHREKLRTAQLGRKYSEEARKKMSEKAKARCERQRLEKLART